MKKNSLLIILFLFFNTIIFAHTNNYSVDIKKSNLKWTGSKITGSNHFGNISLSEGQIKIDHGKLVNAKFVVNMNTITCTDIKKEKKAQYLVDHLKNEDFFDVKNHENSRLNLIKAEKNDNGYKVLAELVIKGITKPVEFDLNMEKRDGTILFSGKLIFDRTKYDIRYGSGSFFDDLGDKAINDDVELEFRIIATISNG